MDEIASGYLWKSDRENSDNIHYRHTTVPVGLDIGGLMNVCDTRAQDERFAVSKCLRIFTPSNLDILNVVNRNLGSDTETVR